MNDKVSRRKFILKFSKNVAIVVGVLSFGKYFSIAQTKSSIIMNKPSNGNHNKILVAYDSQFGSTAEIAKFIGKNISNNNRNIDIKRINEVKNLSQYSDVIIGSAIQYDKWMPEAQDFIIKNEVELSTKSVSFFLVCLVLSKNTEKAKQQVNAYSDKIEKLVPKIKINSFGKFAGVLDYSKMSIGQRILAKVIFAIIGVKEGDYRDWGEIKRWSEGVYGS